MSTIRTPAVQVRFWFHTQHRDMCLFDALEIHPLAGGETPMGWSIFGHYDAALSDERGLLWIGDFPTEELAWLFLKPLHVMLCETRRGLLLPPPFPL